MVEAVGGAVVKVVGAAMGAGAAATGAAVEGGLAAATGAAAAGAVETGASVVAGGLSAWVEAGLKITPEATAMATVAQAGAVSPTPLAAVIEMAQTPITMIPVEAPLTPEQIIAALQAQNDKLMRRLVAQGEIPPVTLGEVVLAAGAEAHERVTNDDSVKQVVGE